MHGANHRPNRIPLPTQGPPRPPRSAPCTKRLTTPLEQFTTKQLQKQSRKAAKDETAEKAKLKKVRCRRRLLLIPLSSLTLCSLPARGHLLYPTSLPPHHLRARPSHRRQHTAADSPAIPQSLQQGNTEGAKIYASNAIRKKNESLNLLRLSSRIDAVSSRVETAVTMRQVRRPSREGHGGLRELTGVFR